MSRNNPVFGSASGRITLFGVTWEAEVNWHVSNWSDETEIDSAYLIAIIDNGRVQRIDSIAMDISEMSMREYDSLLVIANEDRAGGYDDSDADRAYDAWKADQL